MEMKRDIRRLLKLASESKDDFLRAFRQLGQAGGAQGYSLILSEMEKAVAGGDASSFKAMSEAVRWIHSAAPTGTLAGSCSPTSFLILACKHNRVEILKYLLENSDRITGLDTMLEKLDNEGHNVTYYAIRSSNVALLESVINKWPGGYFTNHPEELEQALATAYDDLKLKNVLLSDEMELFVQTKLLNLRFFCTVEKANMSPGHIVERIQLVLEKIRTLRAECSLAGVDDKFIYTATFVAQNIHILKQQLKSTYAMLPWEEMEFCLVCFISAHTKRQELNIFIRAVLCRGNILEYLDHFSKSLESLIESIKTSNVYSLGKPVHLNRDEVIADILNQNNSFCGLYNSYKKIRDVYSLQVMKRYIDAALLADCSTREGQLTIKRALQVMGEHLKNSLESPKLSEEVGELLLLSAPRETRKILTNLRNSLSKTHFLREVKAKDKCTSYTNLQNDINKIGVVITDILFSKKIDKINSFLTKIIESNSLDEVNEILNAFQDVNWLDASNNSSHTNQTSPRKRHRIIELINELNYTIFEKTNYEKELFKQINEIIDKAENNSVYILDDYFIGFTRLKSFSHSSIIKIQSIKSEANILKSRQCLAKGMLAKFSASSNPMETANLNRLVSLLLKFRNSVVPRISPEVDNKIHVLISRVHHINACENDNLMWIDEFREQLCKYKPSSSNVKDNGNNYMQSDIPEDQLGDQLKQKLSDLKDITSALSLGGKLSKKLPVREANHQTKFVIEMILLDIMSILDSSDCLANNALFLDGNTPLLSGKCLRNHLAHGNALFDLLFPDILMTLLSNAKSLTENTIINIKRKIGNVITHDNDKLKEKYIRGLQIISRQEEMAAALREGNMEDLKRRLQEGADMNSRTMNLWTSFHMAAQGPNLEIIKFLLDRKVKTTERNNAGQTALHVAATYGRTNIVQYLVNEICLPLNEIDEFGETPLHSAAQNGHQETVEMLLSLGASHTVRDREGYSPVHCAVANNHVDVAKVLLGKEVNVDANESDGSFTCLHVAASYGHTQLVQYLICNNADVNAKTQRNVRPLHLAALNGHVEVVNALINKGAQVNPLHLETNSTPLHFAVENSHEDIVKSLLEHGAFVNIGDHQYHHTALHWAASNGHKRIVELLIKHKANVDVVKYNGTTPLLCAAADGHLEVVNLLIQNGCRKDCTDANGRTALHLSTMHGHNDIVKYLIESGFDIHKADKHHWTPLHLAADCGNQVAVDVLLAEGADVKSASEDGSTPLHLSARKGHEAASEALIKKGAHLNSIDMTFTPLHEAVQTSHIEIIKLLIKYGADVNVKSLYNTTPLHIASFFGHREAVEVLIKNDAVVDVETSSGDTPLHLAVEGNHKAVVKILVKHDAFTSGIMSTALCRAVKNNYGDLVNILIAREADVNTGGGEPLKLAISAGYRGMVEALLKNKSINLHVKDHNDATLLLLAASNGNWNIGKALIKKGVKIDPETSKVTPLAIAIDKGHKEFVDMLILNGANVNAVLPENISPLHIAVSGGHTEIVEILLCSGAKYGIRDDKNRTALELAVGNDQQRIVEVFFKHHEININEKRNDSWTVLHIAALSGNLEIVKFLVNRGADVNAESILGEKPIHIAARHGFITIIEFFLECGMSIADEGVAGDTLLHYAATAGQPGVARCLIEKRADINAVNKRGMQPIHTAAKEGRLEVLFILLQSGAIYDSKDHLGNKPVHLTKNDDIFKILKAIDTLFKAAKRNDISCIEGSINDGAPINARNGDKSAILHMVCWKGYGQACDILLKNKADPNVTGKGGNMPIHYAAKFSHFKIVQSLLKNSAKYNVNNDSGKTPLDFATKESIIYLLKLVDKSFRRVKSGDIGIINDLKEIQDIDNIKAIMKARNEDGKCLVVVAIDNNFPKVDMLKQVLQENITCTLAMVEEMFIKENFTEALLMLKKVMDERREILGEDNPGTLDVQEQIANVLYEQTKYFKALKLQEEVYQKRMEALGPSNKDTLTSRSSIALILYQLGKYRAALDIFQDVYRKQKEVLGENHLDVFKTGMYTALALNALGSYKEALYMNYISYVKFSKMFGALGLLTLTARSNMATVLNNLGRHDEALTICREIHEFRKKILGPHHSDTLRTLHNMGRVLKAQNKTDQAMKVFQELLAVQMNVLGTTHVDTINTQFQIGILYLSLNNGIDAVRAFETAGADQTILGANHPQNLFIVEAVKGFYQTVEIDINRLNECQIDVITAASEGDIAVLERLIQKGSNVDTADARGRTPLHFAIGNGHADAVKVLLKRGADATAVTTEGNTPLHTAVYQDCIDISEMLLQNVKEMKCNKFNDFINAKTVVEGASALHVACEKGSIQMVQCLLKYGACYNTADKAHNFTPLQYSQSPDITNLLQLTRECFECVEKDKTRIIKKLSAMKADDLEAVLNAKDEYLHTPLQVAIISKHKNMVSSLAGILKDRKH